MVAFSPGAATAAAVAVTYSVTHILSVAYKHTHTIAGIVYL